MTPWLDTGETIGNPRKLARPPVSLDGQVGAALGRVLSISLSEQQIGFSRSKPRLIWMPKIRTLGWWLNVKTPRTSESRLEELAEELDVNPAARVFEQFNGRYERGAFTASMPAAKNRHWYSIDGADAIKYESDKFGRRLTNYVHDFRPGTRLYIHGSTRAGSSSFWMLRGGGISVTARGIV
jgi:hypothetical protein